MVSGGAFLLIAAAYRAARAATVAPFQHSQMVHGALAGWLLFGERPGARVPLGSAIVAASGLYVLRRGTRPEAHR